MKELKEGKARFSVFESVFYNPLARFSRTFGVVAISTFSRLRGKNLVVVDAMAATGIRGLRYLLEGIGIEKVIFNDKYPKAYDNIKYNVNLNGISNYELYNYDVNLFNELISKGYADVIDLDPFGSPSSYIDSLVRNVRHKGMIVLTATDLTALCGLYPNAALRKYFSYVLKTDFCHEVALRILIKEVVVAGGRNNRYVYPLVSIFTEQYARIYAYVLSAKRIPRNGLGYLYKEGHEFKVASLPSEISGSEFIGPLWIGPIHDVNFLHRIQETLGLLDLTKKESIRIEKLLTLMIEEAKLPPYSYKLSKLASRLKIRQPKISDVIDYLKLQGYRAGRSHLGGDLIKTDAPIHVVEDLLLKVGRK